MDETQNRFLEAMKSLIIQKWPTSGAAISSDWLRIWIEGRTSWHSFIIKIDCILMIADSSKEWDFDIANPKFNPEHILLWIKHQIKEVEAESLGTR